MPEGLSPVEVGKPLHEHTKEPPGHAGSAGGTRWFTAFTLDDPQK